MRRRKLPRPGGVLAAMRIRKKLLVIHTSFWLTLSCVLLTVLMPAVRHVVDRAERDKAALLLGGAIGVLGPGNQVDKDFPIRVDVLRFVDGSTVVHGSAPELGINVRDANQAVERAGSPIMVRLRDGSSAAIAFIPSLTNPPGEFYAVSVRILEVRQAVQFLFLVTFVALALVYAIIVLALEVFVLPKQVYGPIQRLLDADLAVREGDQSRELIPASAIPADELGEIMQSRNESVLALRRHESDLRVAMGELERVANDLKRKNHLLEAAKRNLAEADRLASLGIMSAGIAHELNTPLSVLKGLVEQIHADPSRGVDESTAALMLRVVGRLERLSESLLDFARVRPPISRPTEISLVVAEAVTLVRLDRAIAGSQRAVVTNRVPPGLVIEADADRLVQVLVNLIRNSIQASMQGGRGRDERRSGEIVVAAERSRRGGQDWVTLTVSDDGPGIHPDILPRLFEPFVSTKLDSQGTGLGLAVADGIVREHGGILLARNKPDRQGAVFEIVLPATSPPNPLGVSNASEQGAPLLTATEPSR
ncbi:MAG: HAMP domain-containing sensor histidine kinase [Planctomycetota bacterium]|nr:HAMP domain-containing sensor histidine kinase [Planctomycetota bacterium]